MGCRELGLGVKRAWVVHEECWGGPERAWWDVERGFKQWVGNVTYKKVMGKNKKTYCRTQTKVLFVSSTMNPAKSAKNIHYVINAAQLVKYMVAATSHTPEYNIYIYISHSLLNKTYLNLACRNFK
jgi:hypothetical protein